MMKLVFALAATLIVSGAAHAQEYKAFPVKSYVLTEPDGTPRYLVQYAEASNARRVYHVKPVESADSSPRQRSETPRRPVPKKRFIWPTEVM